MVMHFRTAKERLDFLKGKCEEIIPQEITPQEVTEEEPKPKKKKGKKKKDDAVQTE